MSMLHVAQASIEAIEEGVQLGGYCEEVGGSWEQSLFAHSFVPLRQFLERAMLRQNNDSADVQIACSSLRSLAMFAESSSLLSRESLSPMSLIDAPRA